MRGIGCGGGVGVGSVEESGYGLMRLQSSYIDRESVSGGKSFCYTLLRC